MSKANRKEVADTLGTLSAKAEKLQAKLTGIYSKMELAKAEAIEVFGTGTHIEGDWVLDIAEKVSKGRKSTSWAKVSAAVKDQVPILRDKVIKKYPEAEKPLITLGRRLVAAYDENVELNTKTGEDKLTVTVKITEAVS